MAAQFSGQTKPISSAAMDAKLQTVSDVKPDSEGLPSALITTDQTKPISSAAMDATLQTASDAKPDSERKSSVSPHLMAFLAVTFIINAYRVIDRPWLLTFMVFVYGNLFLLYWCFHRLDMTPEDSQRREPLLAAMCLLISTLVLTLTLGFTLAVQPPLAVKILFWSIAGAFVSFVTYAFFTSRGDCNSEVAVGRKALEP